MSGTAPDVGMSPALPTRKALTHVARDKLFAANVTLSRSEISELITKFQELNPWGTKDEFLAFMASEVYAGSKAKRRAAAANTDTARVISYTDRRRGCVQRRQESARAWPYCGINKALAAR
jgi:hypothetical protein